MKFVQTQSLSWLGHPLKLTECDVKKIYKWKSIGCEEYHRKGGVNDIEEDLLTLIFFFSRTQLENGCCRKAYMEVNCR